MMMEIEITRANAMRAARHFWEHHRFRNDDARETYELAVSRLTGLSTKPPPPSDDTIWAALEEFFGSRL